MKKALITGYVCRERLSVSANRVRTYPGTGTQTELDEEFRQWILDYPKDQLPAIRELLLPYSGYLYVFHNREEANSYLQNLEI